MLPVSGNIDDIVEEVDRACRQYQKQAADNNTTDRLNIKEPGVKNDGREDKEDILCPLPRTHREKQTVDKTQAGLQIVSAGQRLRCGDNGIDRLLQIRRVQGKVTPMLPSSDNIARARAHSNIAFIKYWGNRDHSLRLPANSSLSMNLNELHTTTTVAWVEAANADTLEINGRPADPAALDRVSAHLDVIRRRLRNSIIRRGCRQRTISRWERASPLPPRHLPR